MLPIPLMTASWESLIAVAWGLDSISLSYFTLTHYPYIKIRYVWIIEIKNKTANENNELAIYHS